MGLLFFPMLKPYATVLRRWMLARDDPADAGLPLYLDPTAREPRHRFGHLLRDCHARSTGNPLKQLERRRGARRHWASENRNDQVQDD